MVGVLISMIGAGIATAIGEDILNSIGHAEQAKWLKVGGVSLTASLGLGLALKLINKASAAFK